MSFYLKMDREYFRRLTSTGIILILLILSFLLLKSILLAIIFALILAFLFHPLYLRVNKFFNSKNLSAALMCLVLAAIIILPIWFLTPILIKQSLEIYISTQSLDFVTPLKNIFPSIFASETFSQEVGSVISSFVSKASNSFTNIFADLIRNFPILGLQLLIVFFIFFFALKDQEKFSEYIKSILPFPKEIEEKLFESSRGITRSVIYGQVFLGIIQGLLVGIGLWIFHVPNALLFTILAALAGIFPIVGTVIVWAPIAIFLFMTGNPIAGIGVTIFGILSSIVEVFVKPILIARSVNMHSAIILVGMIGGVLLFGVLGVILGPLVLAYLLIVLEIYRNKKLPGVFIQHPLSHYLRLF